MTLKTRSIISSSTIWRRHDGRALGRVSWFEIREPKDGTTTPLLVHIPHSATAVPLPWRSQIVLDDIELQRELHAMTDRYTDELYAPVALGLGGAAFLNKLSRLVFDPERFVDASKEEMSAMGMGAVYTRTSDGRPLRALDFPPGDREAILRDLFRPYATALEQQVSAQLARFGRCLILDGHSFPARPLPYEDDTRDRPDLCLGYVDGHAPEPLIAALEEAASRAGWRVGRNTPFAGSYVPMAYYGKEPRVVSVMLEINRGRYMDETTGRRSAGFEKARELAKVLVKTAVLFEAFRNTSFSARTPNGEICIRVGERCPVLDQLLMQGGHDSWAYVTAWNPGGKLTTGPENLQSQRMLERELRERRLPYHSGEGKGDVGNWPPEASVLILGISEERALDLGQRYGQAAIVFGERSQPARLVLLDSRNSRRADATR